MRPIDADELLKHTILSEDSLIPTKWVNEFTINRMPTLNIKPVEIDKVKEMKDNRRILQTLAKLQQKYDVDFRFVSDGMIFSKCYSIDHNIKSIVFNRFFSFLTMNFYENIEDLVILFNKEAENEFSKIIKERIE